MKKVLSLFMFCLLLLCIIGACQGSKEGETRKLHVVVEFKVDDRGVPEMKVTPATIGANPGDFIVWECDDPFAIHFGSRSPVDGMSYWSRKPEDGGKYTVKVEVVHDHRKMGGMKASYFIACSKDGIVEIIDPDIEVPEKGGGHDD